MPPLQVAYMPSSGSDEATEARIARLVAELRCLKGPITATYISSGTGELLWYEHAPPTADEVKAAVDRVWDERGP